MSNTIESILPRVVLVHGLFMGRHAMLYLAKRLRLDGFEVQCFAYNTITGSLDRNAAKLAAFVRRDSSPVALVGHSLGGLVSIQAAQCLSSSALAAVVLLGSPYQGAKAGRILRTVTGRGVSRIGRALHDWSDLPQKPTVQAPVFTLGGTRSSGLGRLLCGFKEANDGTVTVAETHYPSATACLLPVSHTGMLFNAGVARQVGVWLRPSETRERLS